MAIHREQWICTVRGRICWDSCTESGDATSRQHVRRVLLAIDALSFSRLLSQVTKDDEIYLDPMRASSKRATCDEISMPKSCELNHNYVPSVLVGEFVLIHDGSTAVQARRRARPRPRRPHRCARSPITSSSPEGCRFSVVIRGHRRSLLHPPKTSSQLTLVGIRALSAHPLELYEVLIPARTRWNPCPVCAPATV